MRTVITCFGVFRIKGDIAYFIGDRDFYYTLPNPDMTDEEINDYFKTIKVFED